MSNESTDHQDFDKIVDEHRELRHLLGVIHGALSARIGAIQDICDMLDSFCQALGRHFDEEVALGFFDNISEHSPHLAERATELRDQHTHLLETSQALARRSREIEQQSNWWEEMEERFHRFSKQLMHHETAENHLLQECYDEDIGAED